MLSVFSSAQAHISVRDNTDRTLSSLAQRQAQALRATARDKVRAAQRAWLDQLVKETGKTLSAIAAEAGKPGTTLTRFYNDENYSGVLSHAVVQALSDTTGIVGPGATISKLAGSSNALREDGAPFEPIRSNPLRYAVAAMIGDNTNAHAWTMTSDTLRLAGIARGDVIIVDQAVEPRDGDIVCAQIEQGLGAKTVFRLYQRPAIVGASLDALAVRPEIVDGQRVRIVGVMTGMLRGRPGAT